MRLCVKLWSLHVTLTPLNVHIVANAKVNFQNFSTLLQDQEFYNFVINLDRVLIQENTILNGFY